jgi:flagellin-specific chaperone FliS
MNESDVYREVDKLRNGIDSLMALLRERQVEIVEERIDELVAEFVKVNDVSRIQDVYNLLDDVRDLWEAYGDG